MIVSAQLLLVFLSVQGSICISRDTLEWSEKGLDFSYRYTCDMTWDETPRGLFNRIVYRANMTSGTSCYGEKFTQLHPGRRRYLIQYTCKPGWGELPGFSVACNDWKKDDNTKLDCDSEACHCCNSTREQSELCWYNRLAIGGWTDSCSQVPKYVPDYHRGCYTHTRAEELFFCICTTKSQVPVGRLLGLTSNQEPGKALQHAYVGQASSALISIRMVYYKDPIWDPASASFVYIYQCTLPEGFAVETLVDIRTAEISGKKSPCVMDKVTSLKVFETKGIRFNTSEIQYKCKPDNGPELDGESCTALNEQEKNQTLCIPWAPCQCCVRKGNEEILQCRYNRLALSVPHPKSACQYYGPDSFTAVESVPTTPMPVYHSSGIRFCSNDYVLLNRRCLEKSYLLVKKNDCIQKTATESSDDQSDGIIIPGYWVTSNDFDRIWYYLRPVEEEVVNEALASLERCLKTHYIKLMWTKGMDCDVCNKEETIRQLYQLGSPFKPP